MNEELTIKALTFTPYLLAGVAERQPQYVWWQATISRYLKHIIISYCCLGGEFPDGGIMIRYSSFSCLEMSIWKHRLN